MIGKNMSESILEDYVSQTLHSDAEGILEKAPNLNPEDDSELFYLVMGYHLGKCKYFGLTFPLQDNTNVDELEALSNGYVEIENGVVKMGVVKLGELGKNTDSALY